MSRAGVIASLLIYALLHGCGGGGGGASSANTGGGGSEIPGGNDGGSGSPGDSEGDDEGEGADPLRISLVTTSLSFEYYDTESPPVQEIIASRSGTYDGEIYVGAIIEGTGLSPSIPISIFDTYASAAVVPSLGLSPGEYAGRILFLVCSDPMCEQRIGGTPLEVDYTIRVRRGLHLDPPSLQLQSISGETASGDVNVLLPEGQTSYTASVPAQNLNFLTITEQNPSSISVRAASLPPGTYSGLIQVSSGELSTTFGITYRVAPEANAHGFRVMPDSIQLSANEGAVSSPQSLHVELPSWNPASSEVSIRYADGQPAEWLSVERTAANEYSVLGSAAALSAGTYSAEIFVTTEPVRQAYGIPVRLDVGVGLVAADATVTVTSDMDEDDLNGSVRVGRTSGEPIQWTASTEAPWLTLTRGAGMTGTDLQFSIDADSVRSWSNFSEHIAEIVITAAHPHITPITVDVRVLRELAEITGLGPYLLVSGQSSRVIVRGRGFAGVAAPGSRLSIGDRTAASASRLNDTSMLVDVGGLPVGSYDVRMPNELGSTVPSRTLKVIAAGTYAYSAIPTNQDVDRPFFYDPERMSAYIRGATGLLRFDLSNSSGLSQLPFGSNAGIALNNEGTRLVRLENDSRFIDLLDPETWLGLETIDLGGSEPRNLVGEFGGLVTNDNRAWLDASGSRWEYFDLDRRTFGSSTGEAPLSPVGLIKVISRNGERIVGARSFTHISPEPLRYLDASEGVLRLSAQEVPVFSQLHINDDGSRLLIDAEHVLDENFVRVGTLAVPESAYERVIGVISPDGERAYVLAYATADYGTTGPTQFLPRVYVFDTSVAVGNAALPVIGYFDLAQYPRCMSATCHGSTYANITADGRALMYAGDRFIIVAPIPASLTPVIEASGFQAPAFVRWQ